MRVENIYVVNERENSKILLIEVKMRDHDIGSNFYEVKIKNGQEVSLSCRSISDPILYMQELRKKMPLSVKQLHNKEESSEYVEYLESIITGNGQTETTEVGRPKKPNNTYSLKSEKYNTQNKLVYERKPK